jgi:hypothetical protein
MLKLIGFYVPIFVGPRGMPPAVSIAMDEPPPEYSVAAHLPTYDQAELSKGKIDKNDTALFSTGRLCNYFCSNIDFCVLLCFGTRKRIWLHWEKLEKIYKLLENQNSKLH